MTWGRAIRIGSKIFLGTCPADLLSATVRNCVIVMWGGLWCVCEHARRLAKCVIVHIAINSFGASHQIKIFAMARVEHKGPPMPFMGPLGGPEYAAANPINLHCHCALAYPG